MISAADDSRRLGLASLLHYSLPCRIASAFFRFRDRYRQFRSLAVDEDLRRVVLAPERGPIEGYRFSIGDIVRASSFPGLTRRLKICGVLSGGFSNVYIVIDLDEMRPYCLKENRALPGDEKKRNAALEIEAKIIFTIGSHPNLADPVSAFYFNGRLFILTEYVSGYSLDYQLKGGPLDLPAVLRYGIQTCRAISYSQSVLPGFVHGDIKPSNCLITSDGDLKLTDFGQASARGLGKEEKNAADSDRNSGWGGTRSYMAPEMFENDPSRRASDIYAFGVTLFEMAAGKRPFSAVSKSELQALHKTAEPPLELLREKAAPEGLIDLISQCLAKDPDDRPKSFFEAEKELIIIACNELGMTVDNCSSEVIRQQLTLEQSISHAALSNNGFASTSLDEIKCATVDRAEIVAYKALILENAGFVSQGLAASASALEFNERAFVALYARAKLLFSDSNYTEAEVLLNKALRAYPFEPSAVLLKGQILARTGKLKRACRYFRASLLLDRTQVEPYRQLARVYSELGEFGRSIHFAEQGRKVHSQDTELMRILGKAYFGIGRYIESVDYLKNSFRVETSSKEIRKEFVRSCIRLHRSLGYQADHSLVRLLLMLTKNLGSTRPANVGANNIPDRLELIRHSSALPLLLYYLDETIISLCERMSAGDQERVIEIVKSALTSPENKAVTAYTLTSIGKLLYQFEEYPACIDVFCRVIREFGPDESAYYYLGVCHEVNDDLESALDHYQKGLRLDRKSELLRTSARRVKALIESPKSIQMTSQSQSSVEIHG